MSAGELNPYAKIVDAPPKTRQSRRRTRIDFAAYLFLLPAFALLVAFNLLPMLYNFFISLHEWGIRPGEFIGLENYQTLFKDNQFWSSLSVTFNYVILVVPLEIILGMAIAVLLYQNVRGKSLYRLIYFLPFITSLVGIAIVWGWIFNSNAGFVNGVLRSLGWAEPTWLLDPRSVLTDLWRGLGVRPPGIIAGPSLALVVVSIVTIWYYLGFHIVTFLAGLTAIPADLIEAARMDGAGNWRVFRHIIVPLLSPTTYMLTIIATIGSFQSFTLVYVMTGAGYGVTGSSGEPLGTTRVITLFIFDQFYRFFKSGYGAAAATILFLILLLLTLLQRYFIGRRVHYLGSEDGPT